MMRGLRPFGLLGLLALLAGGLAACASSGGSGGGSSELLSDWQPPSGQQCGVSAEPAVLPPPESVVSLSRLQDAIQGAHPGFRGSVLFSIRQDTTGTWTRVAPIEGDLPQEAQVQLSELLRTHLTTDPTPPLRLRLDLGDETTARIGRQQSCAPALVNREALERALEDLWGRYGVAASPVLRVQARTDGTPGEASLQQGTGHAQVDRELLQLASRLRFHPALSDRVPLETVLQIPLTLGPSARP